MVLAWLAKVASVLPVNDRDDLMLVVVVVLVDHEDHLLVVTHSQADEVVNFPEILRVEPSGLYIMTIDHFLGSNFSKLISSSAAA